MSEVAFRVRTAGRSMWPLLRPGDVAVVEPFAREPREGDIVLYRRESDVIAHRVIGRLADGRLRLQGDFTLTEDAPIAADAILGRLVAVERAGRPVSLAGPAARLLAKAVPLLSRHVPGSLVRARKGVLALAGWVDRAWTAAPMRRLRRLRAPAIDIQLATADDRTTLQEYDRARGRRPDEYVGLVTGRVAGFALLARADGQVVGCTHVFDPPWTSSAGLAGDWWIHDTWVSRRWRGLGIGEELSRRAVEEAQSRGAKRLRVGVRTENHRSRLICEGLGFRRIGELGGHDLLELSLARKDALR